MARKEKPLSVARRLLKSTPKPSSLLRDAYASLWTTAQCEAAGRSVKSAELLVRANKWLAKADKAQRAGEDVPFSRQRLAWVASLAVALEDAHAGVIANEVATAQRLRAERLTIANELRAHVVRRLAPLTGGNEARSAALAIAKGEEVQRSLRALAALLQDWRREARLRLLADEVGLDDGMLEQLETCARTLDETPAPSTGPSEHQLAGRLHRELTALSG
jgi:hypothetical protein